MFTKPATLHYCPVFRCTGDDGRDLNTQVCLAQPDFLINSHGFVLNDISALTMAQNAQEAELLLKRIQIYQADNPDTSKMSVSDLIRTVSPRSAQCPSEVARAAEWIGQQLQDKIETKVSRVREAAAKKAATEAAKKQEVVVTTT